ncbi:hypothetical protein N7474_000751 [Penicillium riverlandense]|uniref:uncharacterized protein n=1 Tax=Penicillium riverlandense TaxID=1903569 RepID=UPI00254743AF|nr:uncharacterized protein N7474_000751 [Penicillium riverlandense]KAJ5832440.1 hypothetical protein N7474_000751 [Penicillium riverlandense]
MSTVTSLERSLSRSSHNSMSSPRLSAPPEATPPDLSLNLLHDRINQLDSRVFELRTTVLTKDGYTDRRNREDQHIRQEFNNHDAISQRIDLNVAALRTDVDFLKADVKTDSNQIKSDVNYLKTESNHIRTDVGHLKTHVNHLKTESNHIKRDVNHLKTDVNHLKTESNQIQSDINYLKTESNYIKTDVNHLQSDVQHLKTSVFQLERKVDHLQTDIGEIKNRLRYEGRKHWNSISNTATANIAIIPYISEDGVVEWPNWFPKTVWRFWRLKQPSRVHRLVELAEFYQLGGYEDWTRIQSDHMMFDVNSDSDSSDEETRLSLTREEAVRQYPEAALQALAAKLGLVYSSIRNEMGEGPNMRIHRPSKRQQEDISAAGSRRQTKPGKMPRVSPPRRQDVDPNDPLYRLITEGFPEQSSTKSPVSEGDELGWDAFPDVSESAKSKLRALDPQDVQSLLRALEKGRLQLKPSGSEVHGSPTRSRASQSHHSVKSVKSAPQATQATSSHKAPAGASASHHSVKPVPQESAAAPTPGVPTSFHDTNPFTVTPPVYYAQTSHHTSSDALFAPTPNIRPEASSPSDSVSTPESEEP